MILEISAKPTFYPDTSLLIKLERGFRPGASDRLLALAYEASQQVTFVLSAHHLLELSERHHPREQIPFGKFLDSLKVSFIRPEGVIKAAEYRNYLVNRLHIPLPEYRLIHPGFSAAFKEKDNEPIHPALVGMDSVGEFFRRKPPEATQTVIAGKASLAKVLEKLAQDRAEFPKFRKEDRRAEAKQILAEKRMKGIREKLLYIAKNPSEFFMDSEKSALYYRDTASGLMILSDLADGLPSELNVSEMKNFPNDFLHHEVSFPISYELSLAPDGSLNKAHRSKAFDFMHLFAAPRCDYFSCDGNIKRLLDAPLSAIGRFPALAVGAKNGSHRTTEDLLRHFTSSDFVKTL